MVNVTLGELAEKLNKFIRNHKGSETTRICHAGVIQETDMCEYPPGTIVFDCKEMDEDEDEEECKHTLTIMPYRIGKKLQ